MATPRRPVVVFTILAAAGSLGACSWLTASTDCRAVAATAEVRAVAAFDANDPAPLSYANIVNRPSRRLEVGRLAHERTFEACRAGDPSVRGG